MSVYINGTGVISAQQTISKKIVQTGFVTFEGNRWPCREPDYREYIDGKQIRRMSRIIRMGITAALIATREAAIVKPDAIIVGTAFGCLEDTHSFLSKLVTYREDMLSPTAFIHSTHNTIAAQIALLFQCRGYNSTYVHRALSFESALTDAMLLLDEGTAENILIGGIDEITDTSFIIMDRLGFYKPTQAIQPDNFYSAGGKGSAAGEGAAFFSLATTQTETCYARIAAVETLSFFNKEEAVARALKLLAENEINTPDLLMTGHNGDIANDAANDAFAAALNCQSKSMKYKQWCGEYATSTAFATWLGAEILKNNNAPNCFSNLLKPGAAPKKILIYNQQDGLHHSLILIQSC